ncbi:MAG: hypothetical protein JSW00_14825 [Thermoplasmata archaeon]|nr:MAG: hypothetical protein JSW00_14825 [Thermoplasmata archaeon]
MKFGIVVCPWCITARGVRLEAKTALCPKCGKRMNLKKTRIICEVNSEKEVAFAVMKHNTKLKGGEEIYARDLRLLGEKEADDILGESQDIYLEVIKKISQIRGRDRRIEAAVRELCRRLDGFTEDDLAEVLKQIGIIKNHDCSEYIDRLMADNVIYRPKNGIYKCL